MQVEGREEGEGDRNCNGRWREGKREKCEG